MVRLYLGPTPTYPYCVFRSLFLVPRALFPKLNADITSYNHDFWKKTFEDLEREGIPSEVKLLSVLSLLSSGRSLKDMYESSKMGRETIRSYIRSFWSDILSFYGSNYLNRNSSRKGLGGIDKQ